MSGKSPFVDIARLQRAIPFPTIEMSLQFGLSAEELELGDSETWPDQIAALQVFLRSHPGDTKRRLKLARLLDANEDKASETEARRVVQETEKSLRRTPKDPLLLLRLGQSLFILNELDKAEKILRKAISITPKNPEAWLSLGNLLSNKSLQFSEKNSTANKLNESLKKLANPEMSNDMRVTTLRKILLDALTPDQLAEMRRLSKEALTCWDRVLKLSPNQPVALINRATYSKLNIWEFIAQQIDKKDPQSALKQMLSVDFINALQDLNIHLKNKPKLIALISILEFTKAFMGLPNSDSIPNRTHEEFLRLEPAIKEPILNGIAQLDLLTRSGDRERRRRAMECKAMLLFFTHDLKATRFQLEEAQRWGSLSSTAISLLYGTFILTTPPDYVGATEILRKVVKTRPSLENHRFLAKTLLLQEKYTEAEAVLESTLRKTNDDAFCLLSLAGCRMKRGELAKAGEMLRRAEKQELTEEQKGTKIVLRGILLGLSGKSEAARTELKKALTLDAAAQEALDALGQ